MAKFQHHDFEKRLHAALNKRIEIISQTPERRIEELTRHAVNIATNGNVNNLQKRFRWDMLYLIHSSVRTPLMTAIYEAGFDDTHIDRSLHRFFKTLNLPFYPQEYNGK